MKRLKNFLLFVSMMYVVSAISAQTNVTSKITNPSFESNGFTGWLQENMQTQGNTAFTLKSGNTYVEKWTGAGNPVGDASVVQTVKNLSLGIYRLTVAAQNTQESASGVNQTGAYIIGNDQQTQVSARNNYTVDFTVFDGTARIGFVAKNATGNWIACDNFRLTLLDDDLSAVKAALQHYVDEAETLVKKKMNNSALEALQTSIAEAKRQIESDGSGIAEAAQAIQKTIDEAKLSMQSYVNLQNTLDNARTLYGDGTGRKAADFDAVLKVAEALVANPDATNQQLADQIPLVEQAMWKHQLNNASRENPLNMNALITNPDFENGFDNWTNFRMQLQGNNSFSKKSGSTYIEKWVAKGNKVGDAFVMQTLYGLENGTYILTASAQHIIEGSSVAQKGTHIVGDASKTEVNKAADYSVEFTVITNDATIGFLAKNATGNWLACDNFRLVFVDNSFEAVKAELHNRIEAAKTLATEKMNADVLAGLQQAIETAAVQLDATDDSGFAEAGNALRIATEAAEISIEKTAFADKLAEGTGPVPTVKTDKRHARGATMAFGRMTVTGVATSNILEQGFCYSTAKEPTVLDERTTDYLTNNGQIYWLRELKPATVYYMRAYAITTSYQVGYGDVIKVITLPKGKINWSYNYSGDAATNNRIVSAIETAYGYWEELTQLTGFYPSIHYSPGTPTADCSYGGWMRMGANASYQAAGTIMHESGHGTGIGTHERWWDTNLHNGAWYGDRANEVLRFWDNNDNATMYGDGMHMWPYGINGAQEDNHSDVLYIANSLIHEGLWEDGVPPTGGSGVGLPAYVFEQEDDVKYYIKNEETTRGFYASYLVENAAGQLVWKEMTAEQAKADDSRAAWYVTFTPSNQYYQFKNAETGHYMSYSAPGTNGIKAIGKTTLTANENFHLMRGRKDVTAGAGTNRFTARGYWILHHNAELNPPAFTANANGATGTSTFNIANSATTQRWLILTAEQTALFENASIDNFKQEYAEYLKELKRLVATPHTENVEGTDKTVEERIVELEEQAQTLTTIDAALALVANIKSAGMNFLANATPSNVSTPFDITFLMQNPAIDDNSGWSSAPTFNFSCCEFFQTTFDFNQTLSSMPAGTYKLTAQAFQRPGSSTDAYAAYFKGTNNVSAHLYAANESTKVQHIGTEAQAKKIGGSEASVGSPVRYIPDNMEAASRYFSKDLYQNEVLTELSKQGNLKVGIKCTSSANSYWTIFDNFHLYYYGTLSIDTITDIYEISAEENAVRKNAEGIYTIHGQFIRKDTQNLNDLQPGVYIVNGDKVFIE